jgi:hypothetical protein
MSVFVDVVVEEDREDLLLFADDATADAATAAASEDDVDVDVAVAVDADGVREDNRFPEERSDRVERSE